MITRNSMIKYLVNETRYTLEDLNRFSDKIIIQWYKEEKKCNAE